MKINKKKIFKNLAGCLIGLLVALLFYLFAIAFFSMIYGCSFFNKNCEDKIIYDTIEYSTIISNTYMRGNITVNSNDHYKYIFQGDILLKMIPDTQDIIINLK